MARLMLSLSIMITNKKTPGRADIIMHPVRLGILLALQGRHLTPAGIADALSHTVPPATLYRHINALAKAGIVEVVGERPDRGAVERLYAVRRGEADLTDEDIAGVTPAELERYFSVFVAGLMSRFADYARQQKPEPDPRRDGVTFYSENVYLTDGEYADAISLLRDIVARGVENGPDPTRRRRTLAVIAIPDPITEEDAVSEDAPAPPPL